MDDAAYFRKRAGEERERAATCEDNLVALTHLRMADEYDRRASRAETAVTRQPELAVR